MKYKHKLTEVHPQRVHFLFAPVRQLGKTGLSAFCGPDECREMLLPERPFRHVVCNRAEGFPDDDFIGRDIKGNTLGMIKETAANAVAEMDSRMYVRLMLYMREAESRNQVGDEDPVLIYHERQKIERL